MRKLILAAAFMLFAVPALASQCPTDMKKIDAALATAHLTAAQLAEVTELRAEGERLHKAGDHEKSVETLAKAKKILGIK